MGISGLLPALKSIQITKHLKDYTGQSVAVDAYVWLHRGVYPCATELATGKKTHKYVDYAMHRVRLLRHYGIKPYIVFDGGPLPAKKGTEHERKQKRDENLARGNALTAQGKHSQAREYYLKCIDVTPQMAFQFIKALRAESVDYVVAPYEADAQLAYLERTGLVDAILTEDSDLLVFGCQNVLFKLDVVASTVVSISRKDFGSLTASSSDSNSISLLGWSDVQFRAMAILSGCDYLPSIPGIGLKTACTLLKRWKSAEQVVRAIMLEGKKSVPPGYWKQFQLAEKCFLHQRVYCPTAGKLVHLTEVTGEWNDDDEAYVGSDMDPIMAEKIALGDADPVTGLPMDDINPSFIPRVLKPLPLVANSPSQSTKSNGKKRESLPTGGILSFFGPNPIIPPRTKQSITPVVIKQGLSGKASGKRRLAEVMDHDIARKKRHRKSSSPPESNQSKFFRTPSVDRACGVQRRHSDGILLVAGSSKLQDKENLIIVVDDEAAETSEPELDGSELSLKGHYDRDSDMDLLVDEFPDVVEQEDGYISPTPSCSKDLQDLSSPLRPGQTHARRKWKSDEGQQVDDSVIVQSDEEAYFGVEAVSSPVSVVKRRVSPFVGRGFIHETPTKWNANIDDNEGLGGTLVHATPSPTKIRYPADDIPSPILYYGPDLRNALSCVTDGASDLDYDEPMNANRQELHRKHSYPESRYNSTSPPSPSPDTSDSAAPKTTRQQARNVKVVIDIDALDYDDLDEEDAAQARAADVSRTNAVMNGWRDRWALTSKTKKAAAAAHQVPVEGEEKTTSIPRGAMAQTWLNQCTPGSGASRVANLKRSNTNVTPQGRHTVSFHPRSAPSKMAGGGSGSGIKPINVKGLGKARRSMLFVNQTTNPSVTGRDRRCREVVDMTMTDDDVDDSTSTNGMGAVSGQLDDIALRAQERLSMFRCR